MQNLSNLESRPQDVLYHITIGASQSYTSGISWIFKKARHWFLASTAGQPFRFIKYIFLIYSLRRKGERERERERCKVQSASLWSSPLGLFIINEALRDIIRPGYMVQNISLWLVHTEKEREIYCILQTGDYAQSVYLSLSLSPSCDTTCRKLYFGLP